MARALMPRQPYSAAVKSDRRSGYIPCPFVKGEGLEWVKDPLFKRGTGESKMPLSKKKDGLILEKKTPNPLAFSQKTLIFAQ